MWCAFNPATHGKKYPAELEEIVKYAEIGCYGSALSCCSSPKLKSKFRQETEELQKSILVVLDKLIIDRAKILQDKTMDGPARYSSYKELSEIIKPLKSVPTARKASLLISKMRMDPVIQKEMRAETEYNKLMQRKAKGSERDMGRINGQFKKLAERYPDTKYGNLAAFENS